MTGHAVILQSAPGFGLGRISYRYIRHDDEKRWHVMTLIV